MDLTAAYFLYKYSIEKKNILFDSVNWSEFTLFL